MSAINIDSLATYGGPFADYAPVEDPTTDQAAAQGNKALAATAGMTHTALRAVAVFLMGGASNATLVSWDALWQIGTPTPPTLTFSATGTFICTWPANVADEILTGAAGYTGPQPWVMRAAWGQHRSFGGTMYVISGTPTTANTATIYFYSMAGSLANPAAGNCDLFFL